jgi:hypothetical protein
MINGNNEKPDHVQPAPNRLKTELEVIGLHKALLVSVHPETPFPLAGGDKVTN